MNNMRRGFTMIELVFVIVIIGILAAVALPRFTGIADDAHVSKLEGFVGTLNRTVGPSLWSGLQRSVPGSKGSILHADTTAHADSDKWQTLSDRESTTNAANSQVESIPNELTVDGTDATASLHDIDLTACAVASTGGVETPIAVGTGTIAQATIAGTLYSIGCIDGSLSQSPHFFLDDGTTVIVK